MRKVSIIMLILTLFTTLMVGCNDEPTNTDVEDGQKDSAIQLQLEEVKDNSVLPKELRNNISLLAKQRGFILNTSGNDEVFLFIALGEKRTAGFELIGKEAIKNNNEVEITVEEIEPKDSAAQVISYPYKVFLVKGQINGTEKFKVVNTNNTPFKQIDLNSLFTKAQGKYIGQIDPHSIEIKIDGENKSFEIGEVSGEFNALGLVEGDIVDITYVENNGQLIIKSIKSPNKTSNLKFAEGIFVGQIDPHSIEMKVNGETKAFSIFQVIDQFNVLKPREGDQLSFTYVEKENGQLIIMGFDK